MEIVPKRGEVGYAYEDLQLVVIPTTKRITLSDDASITDETLWRHLCPVRLSTRTANHRELARRVMWLEKSKEG